MLKLATFAMAALLSTAQLAAQPPRASAVESRIVALENAWNQAQLQHDAKALAALVDTKFVYTDYDGTQMDKMQFLEDAQDRSYRPSFVANEGVKVYLHDNVAIVTGTYHTKGTYKGKPFEHWGRFTDTWLNQNATWTCIASHTNLLKR